ncbi:hypothetical protein RCL1_004190 [Eukaryota sp. TZLM3-RCL]
MIPPHFQQHGNAPVYIRSNLPGNWVLGVNHQNKVCTQNFRGDMSQQWVLQQDGSIKNQQSGQVMDVEREEIHRPGASICVWNHKTSGNRSNQMFQFSNGNIVVAQNPQMCLDIPGERANENKAIALWNVKFPTANNQSFRLEPAQNMGRPGMGRPGQQQQWQQPMPGQQMPPHGMPGQQQWQQPMPGQQMPPHGMPGQQQWQQPMPGQQMPPHGMPGQQQWQQPMPGQQMPPHGMPGQQQWQQPMPGQQWPR